MVRPVPSVRFVAFATALAVALPGTAMADKLVAKGTTLEGAVKSVTGKGVDFQPDFAKDPMFVPWDNIEDLETEGTFQVLYGEDGEITGPITDYDEGELEVGDTTVAPKDVVSAVFRGAEAQGFPAHP